MEIQAPGRGSATTRCAATFAPDFDAPSRALVINLRDDAYLGVCDRVLEVVPADASAREPLRERWKQYKALGLDVNKYDM